MLSNITLGASESLAWAALFVSFIGVIVSLAGLRDAFKDCDAVAAAGLNGPRKIVARAAVRREGMRLLLQMLLGVIAFVSVSLPRPPETMPSDVVVAIGIRNLLRATAAMTLTVSSIWDRVDRYRLISSLTVSGRLERFRAIRGDLE